MARVVFKWTVHRLCRLIEKMLSNRFDCIVVIEGNRGLGKSTLGYLIVKGVKQIIVTDDYGRQQIKKLNFKPKEDILYTRSEIIKSFNDRWYDKFMADEMINVSFNRDFYNENQKRLIKIMNMNRDHCNLFVACVPQFQTIDNQIKNLCKIRIVIRQRGIAEIHTKNRTVYTADRWDTDYNEKIERSWIKNGMFKPKPTKLSTFRGILTFRDLRPDERSEYEEIKRQKRNEIKEQEQALDNTNPNDRIYSLLNEGKIRSREMFDNMCLALNLKPLNVMQNIRVRMKNDGKNMSIKEFFIDDSKEKLYYGGMKDEK